MINTIIPVAPASESSYMVENNCEGTFIGNTLLYAYILLVILKKFFKFDDGVVDIAILGIIIAALALKPLKTLGNIIRIFRSTTIIATAVFICYFTYLSLTFHSNPKLTAIEFLSTFKWLIYYLLGLLLGYNTNINARQLFSSKHLFIITSLVFIYSISSYNWLGLLKFGLSFRSFYDNSFESLFTLRSVFALFGLVLLLYCINNSDNSIKTIIICFSLLFIYMAGNRKMIVALAIIFFIIDFSKRHRLLLRSIKIVIVFMLLAYLPTTELYKKSVIEYTNLDQPRLFAYLKAFEIATDFFPIGSGPSSFASRGSMVDYSPVYKWYGLSSKYGFRPDDEEHFYNDTYWCQIIGQYGAIGIVLVTCILLCMYLEFKSLDIRPSTKLKHKHILLLLVLLSTVTPLFQRTEIALFIFLFFGHSMSKQFSNNSTINE